MLSEVDVHEFQVLFAAKFGIELDHDTAYQKLSLLVLQMGIIYQPVTQKQLSQVTEYEYETSNLQPIARQ